jgi:hypothetical protein
MMLLVLLAVAMLELSLATTSLILYNSTIIDVTSGAISQGTISISDTGIITSIAPVTTLMPTSDASAPRIIDCSGQFIIPGLIDGHVHASSNWPQDDAAMLKLLEWTLRGGVTSVRDMGGDALFIGPYAARSSIATFASPHIYYSALIGGPDFFLDPRCQEAAHGFTAGQVPWLKAIVNDTDCDQAIRDARQVGATGIKVYGDLDSQNVARITNAARKAGNPFIMAAHLLPC